MLRHYFFLSLLCYTKKGEEEGGCYYLLPPDPKHTTDWPDVLKMYNCYIYITCMEELSHKTIFLFKCPWLLPSFFFAPPKVRKKPWPEGGIQGHQPPPSPSSSSPTPASFGDGQKRVIGTTRTSPILHQELTAAANISSIPDIQGHPDQIALLRMISMTLFLKFG